MESLSSTNMPKFNLGEIILIKAKPNSSKSILEWDEKNKKINAFVHSIPDNDKANNELIKLFRKQLKLKVKIISGLKSKEKKVEII